MKAKKWVWFYFCLILCQSGKPVLAEFYEVGGHQIEVTLTPEKPTVMLGEPLFLSFKVQNHSDIDLQVLVGGDYRNALGRPNSFTVAVTNADGKSVPQPSAGMSFGGLFGPQKLPAKGNYSFSLFLAHWATIKEPGIYSVVAQRTLRIGKYTGNWDFKDKADNVEAQASTQIEVVPQDKEKMGALISNLGDTIMGVDIDKAEAAAYRLSAINDERVIPIFIKALDRRNYDLKYKSLRALEKYDTDEAFQGLKKGMETQGKDIAGAATPVVAAEVAGLIRNTAAWSLSNSRNPQALPFLISKRHDSEYGVRLRVVQVLNRVPSAQAIPILQEMARDTNKSVSDEAKRYLEMLSEPKTTAPPIP